MGQLQQIVHRISHLLALSTNFFCHEPQILVAVPSPLLGSVQLLLTPSRSIQVSDLRLSQSDLLNFDLLLLFFSDWQRDSYHSLNRRVLIRFLSRPTYLDLGSPPSVTAEEPFVIEPSSVESLHCYSDPAPWSLKPQSWTLDYSNSTIWPFEPLSWFSNLGPYSSPFSGRSLNLEVCRDSYLQAVIDRLTDSRRAIVIADPLLYPELSSDFFSSSSGATLSSGDVLPSHPASQREAVSPFLSDSIFTVASQLWGQLLRLEHSGTEQPFRVTCKPEHFASLHSISAQLPTFRLLGLFADIVIIVGKIPHRSLAEVCCKVSRDSDLVILWPDDLEEPCRSTILPPSKQENSEARGALRFAKALSDAREYDRFLRTNSFLSPDSITTVRIEDNVLDPLMLSIANT